MQFRTEINIRKLLHAWNGRKLAKLRFSEIQKVVGWNNRKTSDILSKAVKEGYLERIQENGAPLYRNRIADYEGYFDAFEFLGRVDESCRKSGRLQSVEQYLYSFTPFHILAYGVPPLEKLTPLEDELLFTILARFAHAFFDYILFCEAVEKRQYIESIEQIPDSAKSNLFVKEKKELQKELSVRAAHVIYGDVLWEHIFHKIIHDLRFALEKGSLDLTGPIELLNSRDRLVNLAMTIAKEIYNGQLSKYPEPDPDAVERLEKLHSMENPFHSHPKDVAVVITPSPRTMEEYCNQIGSIIKDTFELWDNLTIPASSSKEKATGHWGDVLEVGDSKKSRRELFRRSLIDQLSLARVGKDEPISEDEGKFMLQDSRLIQVFSKDEIERIIESVRSLVKRAKRFFMMLEEGKSLGEVKKDPEWFTDQELKDYKIAEDVYGQAHWKESFGTLGPILMKLPLRLKKMRKLAKAYMDKVQRELQKEKRQ